MFNVKIIILTSAICFLNGCSLTIQDDLPKEIVNVKPCGDLQRDLSKPLTVNTIYSCGPNSEHFLSEQSPLLGNDGKLYSIDDFNFNQKR